MTSREALREKVARTLYEAFGVDGDIETSALSDTVFERAEQEDDGTVALFDSPHEGAFAVASIDVPQIVNALMPLFASVWSDGARWGAVEFGRIEDEAQVQLVPGDNPYREGDPS